MTLRIDLPPDEERRLRERAADRGVDPSALAVLFVREGLSKTDLGTAGGDVPNPNQSTLDMPARWAEEDAADGPTDPAEAQREWEEFRDGMNAHSSRGYPIYPRA